MKAAAAARLLSCFEGSKCLVLEEVEEEEEIFTISLKNLCSRRQFGSGELKLVGPILMLLLSV
jgi:hypothetical protein